MKTQEDLYQSTLLSSSPIQRKTKKQFPHINQVVTRKNGDAALNFANFDLKFQYRICQARTKLVSARLFRGFFCLRVLLPFFFPRVVKSVTFLGRKTNKKTVGTACAC